MTLIGFFILKVFNFILFCYNILIQYTKKLVIVCFINIFINSKLKNHIEVIL